MSTIDKNSPRVALITGGGSGINLAFAKIVHRAGYNIIIADLKLHPQAEEWIQSIQNSSNSNNTDIDAHHRVIFQQTNVTKWSQLEAAFDRSETEFGTCPDLVVPGAGVYEPSSNSFWADNDTDDEYLILSINLLHPIKTSRIAIRRMLRAGKTDGTIVHVSSIAGQRSTIVTPLYTVSKHGINSFVRGMAALQELAGIRVVGVAPGTVGTPLFTEHPEALGFLDLEKDFLLPPDEVAKAMWALVEKRETYAPGTILEVCDIDSWRTTSLLNDPGPQGPASLTSRKQAATEHIKKILEEDRQG